MDRLNLWNVFALGEEIGRLASVRVGTQLSAIAGPLDQAMSGLFLLINPPDPPLFNPVIRVARQPAIDLLEFIQRLLAAASRDHQAVITEKMAREGNELWLRFDSAAQPELSAAHVYGVSQTLGWDTATLVESAELILPTEVQTRLRLSTITELKEAGRCLAFGLYTACGFHTVRATESVIQQYYPKIVGSMPPVKCRNWGAYIKKLNSCGADVRITGFLDHIRENYRNPVTHPEQHLSKNDAQVLLTVCSSSIIQMAAGL